MNLKRNLTKFVALSAALLFAATIQAQNAPRGSMSAGAAKVDFTPAESELPANSLGILDHCYARALVISNGHTKAAFITVDSGLGGPIYEAVAARAERELGIPALNLVITSTHTHSGPRLAAEVMTEKVYAALTAANAALKPARMAYGEGVSYINVNRNMFDNDRNTWWEGANYDGISDKSVSTIYFESLTGEPIAVYYNYAMHAVIAGVLDMVSGDVPGATSTYIENSYNDKIVALWSEGACGDQNPIFFQQTYDLRDIRIADYAKRGEDISNAMPGGGTGMDRTNPEVQRLMNEQKQMLLSMGQMLGEEVKETVRKMRRFETAITIAAAQKTVTTPGRRLLNRQGRAGYRGEYEAADPINIKLGVVMIDDIPICVIGAEVYNQIANRLKYESPYARTMMATVSNGWGGGYMPNDEAFGFEVFEVLGSRYTPGTEGIVVNGFLDMIREITHE